VTHAIVLVEAERSAMATLGPELAEKVVHGRRAEFAAFERFRTPQAQAAIFGMNLHTTSADILRASLESAAFLYDIVRRRLAQRFPDATTIVATGGALSHDTVWTQILADVFGAPIETRKIFEASSRGAAILALEYLGIIKSAADVKVGKGKVFKPDAGRHEAYAAAAAKFEEMYERH